MNYLNSKALLDKYLFSILGNGIETCSKLALPILKEYIEKLPNLTDLVLTCIATAPHVLESNLFFDIFSAIRNLQMAGLVFNPLLESISYDFLKFCGEVSFVRIRTTKNFYLILQEREPSHLISHQLSQLKELKVHLKYKRSRTSTYVSRA